MYLILACATAAFGMHEGVAQSAAQVATLTVEAPQKSFHIGEDVVILRATIKNVSKSDICFEFSPQGWFDAELYDSQDKSGTDLVRAWRQEKHKSIVGEDGSCDPINPGQSVTSDVIFDAMSQLVSHPGLYKLVVSRREVMNNVVIKANPVTIEFVAK
jgi:hypothetical protein